MLIPCGKYCSSGNAQPPQMKVVNRHRELSGCVEPRYEEIELKCPIMRKSRLQTDNYKRTFAPSCTRHLRRLHSRMCERAPIGGSSLLKLRLEHASTAPSVGATELKRPLSIIEIVDDDEDVGADAGAGAGGNDENETTSIKMTAYGVLERKEPQAVMGAAGSSCLAKEIAQRLSCRSLVVVERSGCSEDDEMDLDPPQAPNVSDHRLGRERAKLDTPTNGGAGYHDDDDDGPMPAETGKRCKRPKRGSSSDSTNSAATNELRGKSSRARINRLALPKLNLVKRILNMVQHNRDGLDLHHSSAASQLKLAASYRMKDSPPNVRGFMAMISYHRLEGQEYALSLKGALERLGVSVYLDLHEIRTGSDWQDSLNEAVLNCQAFIPLVTPSYGETLWTGRELKLADVLAKHIIPVNFGQRWPPPSLAIQFATKQYIFWLPAPQPDQAKSRAPMMEAFEISRDPVSGEPLRLPRWRQECVESVARQIKLSMAQANLEAELDSGYDSSPVLHVVSSSETDSMLASPTTESGSQYGSIESCSQRPALLNGSQFADLSNRPDEKHCQLYYLSSSPQIPRTTTTTTATTTRRPRIVERDDIDRKHGDNDDERGTNERFQRATTIQLNHKSPPPRASAKLAPNFDGLTHSDCLLPVANTESSNQKQSETPINSDNSSTTSQQKRRKSSIGRRAVKVFNKVRRGFTSSPPTSSSGPKKTETR